MKKERKEQGSKKEKKINLDKTRGATAVYRQLLGHPAPRTRTQVAELKLAVTRTPKKGPPANFITFITPKIG